MLPPMRLSPPPTLILVFSLLLAGGDSAISQGTQADYQRAISVGKRSENKVFRAKVRPQWLAGNDAFWFVNDLAEGRREFLFVDAVKGEVRSAFDHARLAAGLSKIMGKPIDAERLPVERLEFDGTKATMRFSTGGKRWQCDLGSYEVRAIDADKLSALPSDLKVRPSRAAGDETAITFVNRTADDAVCFWIDPSGGRIPYATLKPGESHRQHTFVGHVWLVVSKSGKTLGVFEGGEGGGEAIIEPRAEPNPTPVASKSANAKDSSPWKIFIRDSNVFATHRETKQEVRLSEDGTPDDPYAEPFLRSPDGSKFIARQVRKGDERKVTLVESSPADQLQPKVHEIPYPKPGDKIPQERPRLFDLTNGRQIPIEGADGAAPSSTDTGARGSVRASTLFSNPWDISELRWAPDGKRFTFLFNQRGHQLLRVVAVDAASGEASVLVEERSPTFIDYSQKTFLRFLDASNELVWMSERDGWNHLWLYDSATGQVKNQITRGEWVVRKVERVDPERRQIWFTASGIRPGEDPYFLHLARVNFDGTGLAILTEGDGTHRWEFSPDNRWLLDTWSRVDLPPISVLRNAETGAQLCPLQNADAEKLTATGWRAPERFSAKGRDGTTDIFGIIIRPSNFDPAKKYPVVERIYAGPHDAFVPKDWGLQTQQRSIAELGFIVVQIDGMGTNWRSRAFHDVCWKNLKDAGFPDRIAWLQAAAKTHPEMDLTRVGIYGGSAGGQSALGALLFHGDFYRAAAADCGCHDNRMDKIWWNEAWMGWPIGPEYADNSNVTHAKNLTGHLFLTFAELDKNVDPSSSMQVVNALIKADKDFDLLIVPGAGHGIGESPYAARRRQDFFVRHLLHVEPRSR